MDFQSATVSHLVSKVLNVQKLCDSFERKEKTLNGHNANKHGCSQLIFLGVLGLICCG